ncbi:MAG: hypothetical protein JWO02_2939 [Solirubrobacterales bacterium]|nr:hypothetical protein [Solirubrobacterales bacterium]
MLSELQQYLRHAAAQHHEVVRSGPFLIHLDELSDQPYANYAIPDDGAEPTPAEVSAMTSVFAGRGRRAAFEYLPDCAPAVHDALVAGGLQITDEITVMVCPSGALVDLAPPHGVRIVVVGARTPDATIREVIAVQHAAFGVPAAGVGDEEVVRFRRRAADGVAAYAVHDGRVIGGGVALVIRDGLTELAGIAVAEAARRRGVAAALTATLTRSAIDRGVHLPFLTRRDESAGRVYERAGYRAAGRMLHLAAPASGP